MAVLMLSGCSTLQQARGGPGQKLDPWENWNRKVFSFNESVDNAVLKPAATAYSNVVPEPVRDSVNNFFGNFSDAWSAINSFLQGKVENGATGVIRVGTNTVFGLLGIFDVAGEAGIPRNNEDFGQTLGHWGVGPGAYVVWPLFGPSTVRDSFALPLDNWASPSAVINDGGSQLGLTTLQLINRRASLLGASKVIDDIALDKYTFVRDGYLQRRRSLVLDGEEAPREEGDGSDGADYYATEPAPEPVPTSAPAPVPTQK